MRNSKATAVAGLVIGFAFLAVAVAAQIGFLYPATFWWAWGANAAAWVFFSRSRQDAAAAAIVLAALAWAPTFWIAYALTTFVLAVAAVFGLITAIRVIRM